MELTTQGAGALRSGCQQLGQDVRIDIRPGQDHGDAAA